MFLKCLSSQRTPLPTSSRGYNGSSDTFLKLQGSCLRLTVEMAHTIALAQGGKPVGFFHIAAAWYIYQILRSPFPKNILGNGQKTVQRCFPLKGDHLLKKATRFGTNSSADGPTEPGPNSHLVMKGCHGIDAKAPPVLVGEVVSLCWLVNSSFNPFETYFLLRKSNELIPRIAIFTPGDPLEPQGPSFWVYSSC